MKPKLPDCLRGVSAPTGLCPKAQGCEASAFAALRRDRRATLGHRPQNISNRNAVAAFNLLLHLQQKIDGPLARAQTSAGVRRCGAASRFIGTAPTPGVRDIPPAAPKAFGVPVAADRIAPPPARLPARPPPSVAAPWPRPRPPVHPPDSGRAVPDGGRSPDASGLICAKSQAPFTISASLSPAAGRASSSSRVSTLTWPPARISRSPCTGSGVIHALPCRQPKARERR